jgi:hypothetical protein
MNNLKTMLKKNRFRAAGVIGAIFLVIGVSIFCYSVSAIQERENMLNSGTLTIEETWSYEGSLSWWRNAYVTVFLPLTAIFVATGIAGLLTQPIYTRVYCKNVLKSFSNNVKLASDEIFEKPKLD